MKDTVTVTRMLDIHLKRIKAGGNLAQARVTVV